MQYCQVSRFSVRRINRLFRDSPETSRIFHPLRENDPGTKFSGKKEFDDEDVGSAEKTIHPGGKENSFQRQSNVLVPKSMPGIAQNSARNGEEKKSGFRFEAIRSAGTKAVTVAAAILSGKRDFLWHFLVLFTVRQIPSWSFFPILYNYAGSRRKAGTDFYVPADKKYSTLPDGSYFGIKIEKRIQNNLNFLKKEFYFSMAGIFLNF